MTTIPILEWPIDDLSRCWAEAICLLRANQIRPQYAGSALVEATWAANTLSGVFPEYCRHPDWAGYVLCSPRNIVTCFAERRMLEGLTLTVGWGGMARTKRRIYAHPKDEIAQALLECSDAIVRDRSVGRAWQILTRGLGWTDVMTSKCLHFLARSVGFEANPPVPIDGFVMEGKVWPEFRRQAARLSGTAGLPAAIPAPWRDGECSWDAYTRYMTVINTWAVLRGWSSTAVENTLFAESI